MVTSKLTSVTEEAGSAIANGLKQTEAGLIPKDWLAPQLQQIAEDDSPICYGIVQVGSFTANGIPVLAIKNLNLDYRTNIHRASEEVERPYSRSRIRPEDVLISIKGTTGRVGIVPNHFRGNISRDLARIRTRKGISPRFIYQMLQSDDVQRRLSAAAVGTTRMELSISVLKQIRIPLPSTKTEQDAIAETLIAVDELIESLEMLIDKKRQIKQGAMQELLTGKKRLAGFRGDWKRRILGEIAHIKTGGRNNQDKIDDGKYPFFVRSASVESINTYSYECEAILVPGEGNIGNIFHYVTGRFDVHQRVYAITQFHPDVSGRYLYFYMAENFGNYAIQNSVKATVDSLRLPTFLNFEVAIPPTLSEQTAIADTLSAIDADLAALERRLSKVRMIKQGMMQELLTGRIRLI